MKLLLAIFIALAAVTYAAPPKEEIIASEYLVNLNKQLALKTNLETVASWNYASNITDENEARKNEVSAEVAKFMRQVGEENKKFNWRSYQSDDLRRQFKMMTKLGYAALPEAEYAELLEVLSSMESNFAKVRVCDYNNRDKCDLSLDPDLEEIISKSRDPEELKYYWTQFYDKAGTAVRPQFERYIEFNRKAAILNSK